MGQSLHFTAAGYRTFGKRYAEVMLEQLGVIPVENRNYYIRYESHAGANLWDQQAIYTLPQALEKDAKYSLTMKVRTSASCEELAFWPIWYQLEWSKLLSCQRCLCCFWH